MAHLGFKNPMIFWVAGFCWSDLGLRVVDSMVPGFRI